MNNNAYQAHLDDLAAQGRLRQLPDPNVPPCRIDLQSNDYLGIARDPALYQDFLTHWIPSQPSGSASRLLGGNAHSAHHCETLARDTWGIPALYLNSGYHANIGILPALTSKRDLILADKDIHASLIDGIRLSDAKLLRWHHQNLDNLASLLAKHRHDYDSVWLITESIFSMDGSLTDLPRLAELAHHYNARLYIDEAHAVGIYGDGRGRCAEQGINADIIVMPLAKAMASYGALVLCQEPIRSTIINRCRSLIFASALPPIVTDWTAYLITHLADFAPRRHALFTASEKLQRATGNPNPIATPIIPIIIGDETRTLHAAQQLLTNGIRVGAVRHPTVPLGKAQLRLCAHAGLTDADIHAITSAIQPWQ